MMDIVVEDMSCGHCVSMIARTLKELDAAARCEIDLAARRVRITGSTAAPGEILDAIREAGYTPRAA